MTFQLYGFWRSNAAFRVRVALALKALPYEEIDVALPAFAHAHPFAQPGYMAASAVTR